MGKRGQAKELFTASEVARFCQVDLKTIHNWADRGEIRHFRTPGRHLRFRSVDVLDFLRKYGYPVPDILQQGKPSVHVVDEDPASLSAITAALGDRYEVRAFTEAVDALIAVGADKPDVVIIDLGSQQLDSLRCVRRLHALESTRHVRVVAYAAGPEQRDAALEAGASAFVPRPGVQKLVETLDALLGTGR